MNRIGLISKDGTEFLVVFNKDDAAIKVSVPKNITPRAYLTTLIGNNALATLCNQLKNCAADFPAGSFVYNTPIGLPEKILCVGVNYPLRNEEYKDGQDAPAKPSLFVRFLDSFTGHGHNLVRPKASTQLDYEGEFVIIIGKGGRHISKDTALEHIAALTLANDGTLRDWAQHAKFNVTQGKNFDRSGAIGPWLVPFENPKQIESLRITTKVNGELRQNDLIEHMIFNIPFIIQYISTFTTLKAGDVILTGTPTGAGAHLNPQKWLKPGDLVEVNIEGIGTLKNGIEDEISA